MMIKSKFSLYIQIKRRSKVVRKIDLCYDQKGGIAYLKKGYSNITNSTIYISTTMQVA